ncbi:unnamed protein product (mitochondrion) [Plasmodiophora brassicae]|uniref:Uncharacterized protein n=1 Tax=Plasmodiophora brassicae TaxID=37360 RepID=A0A3P3YKZ9_PLABS|nr:unnamed protein product [Plasmodiophora brassicae]
MDAATRARSATDIWLVCAHAVRPVLRCAWSTGSRRSMGTVMKLSAFPLDVPVRSPMKPVSLEATSTSRLGTGSVAHGFTTLVS